MNERLLETVSVGDDTKPLLSGSSKDFYPTGDASVLRVQFKDIMHGRGRTQEVEGSGRLREEFCFWFYRLLEQEGIRTHIATQIADIRLEGNEPLLSNGILVRRMNMVALELIARYITRGNWVDEHKFPLFPAGIELEEPIAEMCLKWKEAVQNIDFEQLPTWQKKLHAVLSKTPIANLLLNRRIIRDDPRINADVAIALHVHAKNDHIRGRMIESQSEADYLRKLTLDVNNILREFLASQGWVLEDGKFEVGIPVDHVGREFFIGDEYTQDSSRVRDRAGNSLTKDLHRNMKSSSAIYDGYAKLTEAIREYTR
jgi:phosphoribosylaminoimidazole-succinocarboxamide synthase